ncbi:hypothetical protein GTP58_24475 [Duganella sp. CY15W]|uniref:hypothetical protein n=1 Tax=Duganella sp. CY15W TaxID=2692172 RepID=UPI00136AE917|nr:hypothetical protein [Duganella sp. CY15W]MYM31494.1 hypothetical protein [Duganella sp. CY15W]
MAGVKGKSGGARANAGGARAGAGRKPKETAAKSANAGRSKSANANAVVTALEKQPHGGSLKRSKSQTVKISERSMLQLLQDIALGQVEASGLQVRAAIAAVQYTHTKKGDGGKKDEAAEKARAAGAGKFAATAPPKLVAAGGKKV